MGWKAAGSLVRAGKSAGCELGASLDFGVSGSLEIAQGDFACFFESPSLFSATESVRFADSACELCCSAGMAALSDETVAWKTLPLGAAREASG